MRSRPGLKRTWSGSTSQKAKSTFWNRPKWYVEKHTSSGTMCSRCVRDAIAHVHSPRRAQADRKRKRKMDAEDNAGVVGVTLRTTAIAAEKRAAKIPVDLVAYERQKREQPEFYRAGDSLLYGGKGEVAPDAVDRMVAELNAKYVHFICVDILCVDILFWHLYQ